jgi:Mg2+ and Co2+ transporter CorA
MKADFQHTAYTEARAALRTARHQATQSLAAAFPDAMVDSLVPAIDQAMRLCHEASRIIQQMQQSHTKDKVVSELKRRCPGYSDNTYEAAAVDAFTDYIR